MKHCITMFLLTGILSVCAGELEAILTLKSTEFKLDKDQVAKVEAAQKAQKERKMAQPPKPVAIDGELVLKNTGKDAVTINMGGDGSMVQLDLTGPGAVTMPSMMMMTMEFRMGKNVEIAPGKSVTIPIKSLAHGRRNISKYTYWTKAGTYELKATYKSRKDSYTSEAVKITVTE